MHKNTLPLRVLLLLHAVFFAQHLDSPLPRCYNEVNLRVNKYTEKR